MTTKRGRCPPAPPVSLSRPLDTTPLAITQTAPWARIFRKTKQPLGFDISKYGNRFDPLALPWADKRVLYAAESLEIAIAEVVLRWHAQVEPSDPVSLSESTQLKDRMVARFVSKRPLSLIDATGLAREKMEKVVTEVVRLPQNAAWANDPKPLADDIFQCAADEYVITQQWGSWFRSQHPTADGLTWMSRQFNVGRCVVLFDDRCAADLALHGTPVPLYAPGSEERRIVDRMVGQLGWGIEA